MCEADDLVLPLRDPSSGKEGVSLQRSRHSLFQQGQKRMNVTTDVGSVHLKQHAQRVHEDVVPQVDYDQQLVSDIKLALSAWPNATLPSLPKEGRAISTLPAWFKLGHQGVKFIRSQAAERLERSGSLAEPLHTQHPMTLPHLLLAT